MKDFFKLLSTVFIQAALLFGIAFLIYPSTSDEYLSLSNHLKASKVKFRSAERYFYLEAKKRDEDLKKGLQVIDASIADGNYSLAEKTADRISAKYPDQADLSRKVKAKKAVFMKKQKEDAEYYFMFKDYPAALKYLEKADQTDTDVLYMSGFIYANVPNLIDYPRAFECLKKASPGTEVRYELARLYEKGYGVRRNVGTAISLYEKNVEKNHIPSIRALAKIYAGAGHFDFQKAKKLIQRWIESGQPEAIYCLAELLLADPAGKPRDMNKIVGLYRSAQSAGFAPAAEKLASLYLNNKVPNPVDEERKKLFSLMAGRGKAEYQLALGLLYLDADSASYSPRAALDLLKKAALSNNAKAYYYLGICYESGIGTARSDARALEAYRNAAQRGYAKARERADACRRRLDDEQKRREWLAKERQRLSRLQQSERVKALAKTEAEIKAKIPSDHAIYLPLDTDWRKIHSASRARVELLSAPPPVSKIRIDGIACSFLDKNTRILIKGETNISQGNHSHAVSIWCRNKRPKRNYWHAMMVFCGSALPSRCNRDIICMRDYGWYSCYTNDNGKHVGITTNIRNDDKWHHFVCNYDASEGKVSFCIDGKVVGSAKVGNSRWNLADGGIVLGGKYPTPGEYEDLYDPAFFAGFRVYDRALSQAEISALAHEFTPTRR